MMLPFNETTVPKIDVAARQIVVVPPAETSSHVACQRTDDLSDISRVPLAHSLAGKALIFAYLVARHGRYPCACTRQASHR